MAQRVLAIRLKLSGYKLRLLQSPVIAEQRRNVNFAFIHISKCGGTSVTNSIGERIKPHVSARERLDKLEI